MNCPLHKPSPPVRAFLWNAFTFAVIALAISDPAASQTLNRARTSIGQADRVTQWDRSGNSLPSLGPSPTARYRYETHFETQQRVTYQPQVRVVEQKIRRLSWNPFEPPKYERRLVPTIHWVPSIVEDRLPVTERVAMDAAPNKLSAAESSQSDRDQRDAVAGVALADDGWRPKKNPRLAAQNIRQPSGVMSIDRVPTRNFQTRSIGDLSPTQFGGVQKLDEGVPRVGMQFRDQR